METLDWTSLGTTGAILALLIYSVTQIVRDVLKNKKDKNTGDVFNKLIEYTASDAALKIQLLKVLEIVAKQYTEEITEAQMESIIDVRVDCSKYLILDEIHQVITMNNIAQDKANVMKKIRVFIENRFEADMQWLNQFTFKGERLGNGFNIQWAGMTAEELIPMVINKIDRRTINAFMHTSFYRFKLEATKHFRQ